MESRGAQMMGDVWCGGALCGETVQVLNGERAVIVTIHIIPGLTLYLERFRKNPVVLLDYDYEGLPIARSLWERISSNGIDVDVTVKLQFHLDTELSREVWACVRDGVLSDWRIGVIPSQWNSSDGEAVIQRVGLCSISCIPAHCNEEHLTRLLRERKITDPSFVRAIERMHTE